MRGFYPILTQTYTESNSNDYLDTELVQTKFNMGNGMDLDPDYLEAISSSGSVNFGTWERSCAGKWQHNSVNLCCRSSK